MDSSEPALNQAYHESRGEIYGDTEEEGRGEAEEGLMRKPMTDGERREVAFHETGHVAMVYWREESLGSRAIVLRSDRFGGSLVCPVFDLTESDLMVLIGGPMAELLSMGIIPKRAIRFSNTYRDANSDSNRIRALAKKLRGKDDRAFQFEVQERCRGIIQHPATWRGIGSIAEQLIAKGRISGEDCEWIFEGCDAPQMIHTPDQRRELRERAASEKKG